MRCTKNLKSLRDGAIGFRRRSSLAIRDKKLLPVADLDRGFIRPEYPTQVNVSYYQGGKILDYVKERWGDDKILDMVHSYAQLKTTPEVIQQDLGMSPEEFDKAFMEWLYKDVGKSAASFDEWRNKLKELAEAAKAKNWDEVLAKGDAVRQLYPDYVEGANPYEFMAEAYIAKGDKKSAAQVLSEYEKIGGRNPEALKELASLEQEAGDAKEAAATLEGINYIYPMDEGLHRKLCDLLFDLKNPDDVRECSAVLSHAPVGSGLGAIRRSARLFCSRPAGSSPRSFARVAGGRARLSPRTETALTARGLPERKMTKWPHSQR